MASRNKTQCLILGEIHTSKQSRAAIEQKIKEFRPDILLHELLYDDFCHTPEDTRQRLRSCRLGSTCDPRLNKDIYQLGLELKIPLLGIDLPQGGTFRERETHMVNKIEGWFNRGFRMVVVVGDTHLRDMLLPRIPHRSLIRNQYDNNPKVTIERAPNHLQEVK